MENHLKLGLTSIKIPDSKMGILFRKSDDEIPESKLGSLFRKSDDEIPDSKTGFLFQKSGDEAEEWSNGHSGRSSILTDDSEIFTESLPSSSASFQLRGGDESRFASFQLRGADESRFNRCLATLTGHQDAVSCLATSGEILLSASQGTDIRAWQQPDLHQFATFGRGDGAVKALVAVGDRVVSAHQDQRIRVWKRSKSVASVFKLVATMPTVRDRVVSAMNQKNYVQTRRHHRSLWIEHADAISCLAVSIAVKKRKKSIYFLYSGSWDRTFKVWRLSDFKCMESTRAHDDAINAVAVGPYGYLYTASADATVKVWSKPRGSESHVLLATMVGHSASVNALAVSEDSGLVYSGGSDGAIVAWQSELGDPRFEVAAEMKGEHLGAVLCLCTVHELLCSGSEDRTIRVWKRDRGSFSHSIVAVLEGHEGPVKSIAASADVASGFLIYSGSIDRSIKVWWVSGHQTLLVTPPLAAGHQPLSITPPDWI